MLAHFFINRPIFAWVIGIVIMLAGAISLVSLPIAQYPEIAPPTISISASYTGASAETIENTVTQIIEQQLTGIDNLIYFSSASNSNGTMSTTLTFEPGTNPDIAQVQVQNKVQQALPLLPQSVQELGVIVNKAQSDFLLVIALYDETDQSTSSDVSDYLVTNMQDPIARINGVGGIHVFGTQYAMRIWFDPVKLGAYSLTPDDLSAAIRAQNAQVSSGKIGAVPAVKGQELNATVTAQSLLRTPEQFGNIIIKSDANGAVLRLKDVARIEMGSENYDSIPRLNRHPASGIAIQLASGANALTTVKLVRDKVLELTKSMPQGYKINYPIDSTKFIVVSIEEVVKTLIEAIFLVILVMFIFLQNWRATLIPTIAVPIVLLGTLALLNAFGYSINTLTMFGMVLSIGLLVDDAIVVVENVERIMEEENLSPRDATLKSMNEITSALVGIATVLSAVFLPMAFFPGSTGVIYRQFSITIVSSMILSVLVAIIITPALCSTILKPYQKNESHNKLADWFNRKLALITISYKQKVIKVLQNQKTWMSAYAVLLLVLGGVMYSIPTGFLPDEDQGETMAQFTLPQGASINRTMKVAEKVEDYYLNEEKKDTEVIFTISGYSFSGVGQNTGMAFVHLTDWDDRKSAVNSAGSIANRATKALSSVRDAQIFALVPPTVRGLGRTSGFDMELQATGGTTRGQLQELLGQFLDKARNDPNLINVRLGSLSDTAQLHLNVDVSKASALGLEIADVNSTLAAAWGGFYVNQFIDRGRVKKVYIQADKEFRSNPDDLSKLFIRNNSNLSMTPVSSFTTAQWKFGPESLTRYNGLASYDIQGNPADGVSSGTAIDRMDQLVSSLPEGAINSWTGLSYEEKLSGSQTSKLYSLSILVVFLCLAALYESWSIPFSILLVIPLGVIGAALATKLRGLNNDVYFQVALLATIGLSSKNAILIVEFAEASYLRGNTLVRAAIEGARLRLRPILMTSLAFIVGVFPLAISTGAGANSRIAIGTAIVGGTLTATILAIFMVPLFFVLVQRLVGAPRHRDGTQDVGDPHEA